MPVPQALGVHLLPSTGEWAYDTVLYTAAQWNFQYNVPGTKLPMNTFFAPGGKKTDYSYALDQLQEMHPETTTVSLVVGWFFDNEALSQVHIYPSTMFIKPMQFANVTTVWEEPGDGATTWMCSRAVQFCDL